MLLLPITAVNARRREHDGRRDIDGPKNARGDTPYRRTPVKLSDFYPISTPTRNNLLFAFAARTLKVRSIGAKLHAETHKTRESAQVRIPTS